MYFNAERFAYYKFKIMRRCVSNLMLTNIDMLYYEASLPPSTFVYLRLPPSTPVYLRLLPYTPAYLDLSPLTPSTSVYHQW